MKKMKLITEVKIAKDFPNISHTKRISLFGSCFSENIYHKLKQSKFPSSSNPFGISFNPISIHQQLDFLVSKNISYLNIASHQDYHFSYLFSKAFCLPYNSKEELKKEVNKLSEKAKVDLDGSDFIFLTYGTAWIYELKSDSKIVNNCHKQEASLFHKRLLSVSEIVESFRKIHSLLKDKKVVFTVSPVRHQKDGLHQNQLSKSTLLLAIEEICRMSDNYFYFPSYEIILDELRDYRFFSKDLLHPNEIAIDYLWEKFQSAFFDEKTLKIVEEVSSIRASLNHKSFKKDSKEDMIFKAKLREKISQLEIKSNLSFEQDLKKLD
jgi:hypothetical protein